MDISAPGPILFFGNYTNVHYQSLLPLQQSPNTGIGGNTLANEQKHSAESEAEKVQQECHAKSALYQSKVPNSNAEQKQQSDNVLPKETNENGTGKREDFIYVHNGTRVHCAKIPINTFQCPYSRNSFMRN